MERGNSRVEWGYLPINSKLALDKVAYGSETLLAVQDVHPAVACYDKENRGNRPTPQDGVNQLLFFARRPDFLALKLGLQINVFVVYSIDNCS